LCNWLFNIINYNLIWEIVAVVGTVASRLNFLEVVHLVYLHKIIIFNRVEKW